MNVRFFCILALIAVLGSPTARAQGFAGLGIDAEGFERPHPGTELHFPRDHGPHPGFRIEWWYLTATLTGPDGANYGAQWTLFRTALTPEPASGWNATQLWLGHSAVTSRDTHHFAEKRARGGTGEAGATALPFAAWIHDWQMESRAAPGADALSALELRAGSDSFAMELTLETPRPLILHGQAGYSVKSDDGQASYYYSQPFYTVSGTLRFGEDVIPVTGQAWLDREWSSQPLSPDQTGWDWVSLALADGAKLMAFRLRDAGAGYTSATWITPKGQATALPNGKVRFTPLDIRTVAGREIPTRWRVELPEKGVDVTLSALNPAAWMETSIPYWEGPVGIEGTHIGSGYLEMTGY